jgi:restriction system protein
VTAPLLLFLSLITAFAVQFPWLMAVGVFILCCATFCVYKMWRSTKDRQNFLALKLHEVDKMSGFAFEKYVAELLTTFGYQNVQKTPHFSDHGADLLFEYHGQRFAAQLKRYRGYVGVEALYQAAGGRDYYKADRVAVITNSYFSEAAKKHAKESNYWLVDRDGLKAWIAAISANHHW